MSEAKHQPEFILFLLLLLYNAPSSTNFTIMGGDGVKSVIFTGLSSNYYYYYYYFKFESSEQYRDGTAWCGVISIGERLMSGTMTVIANKRLQEIHSLFHYTFFLSRLLHKRKLVSRLWRHFRMTGASDEVITEQLC